MITRLRQKSLPKADSLHKHLEVRRAAWQRKRKVENEGNTDFYISGGLCLTSECIKLKFAGKKGRMLHFQRLSACIPAPHSSSPMPAPLGDQQPAMLPLCLHGVNILNCCKDSYPVYLCSASHMSRHIFLIVLFSLLCYFNLERRRSRIILLTAFLQSISIPWVFLRDPLFQNTVALSACFCKSS